MMDKVLLSLRFYVKKSATFSTICKKYNNEFFFSVKSSLEHQKRIQLIHSGFPYILQLIDSDLPDHVNSCIGSGKYTYSIQCCSIFIIFRVKLNRITVSLDSGKNVVIPTKIIYC
jgi:hypothetical protein